jgi:hypothetical protein
LVQYQIVTQAAIVPGREATGHRLSQGIVNLEPRLLAGTARSRNWAQSTGAFAVPFDGEDHFVAIGHCCSKCSKPGSME